MHHKPSFLTEYSSCPMKLGYTHTFITAVYAQVAL